MYAYSQNHGPCAKQTVGSPDLCAYSRSAEDATQGEPLGVVMVKGQGSVPELRGELRERCRLLTPLAGVRSRLEGCAGTEGH